MKKAIMPLFLLYQAVIRFGDSVEEAQANILEAIEVHVESMLEDGEPVPMERDPVFITRLSVPISV